MGAFAAVLCLASVHGCNRGANLLATVNGEPITLSDFEMYLANKPRVVVATDNGKATVTVSGTLGGQAVVEEVKQQVEMQLAREKGVYPTDAELEQDVNLRQAEDPTIVADMAAQGVTLAEIRRTLLVNLVEEKLLTQGIHVTIDQAKDYVRSHPDEFITPARIRLAYILVGDQASEKAVDDALSSGQAFIDVALKMSQADTASSYNANFTDPGAEAPAIASLPDEVRRAISHLAPYNTSAWVPYGGAFAKFYVLKVLKPEKQSMDSNRLEILRRDLARREGEQVNNLDQMVKQRLAQSTVKIYPEEYRNALDDPANSP